MTRSRSAVSRSPRAAGASHRDVLLASTLALTLAPWLAPGPAHAQLPLEPARDAGEAVTAAYEGWFRNTDGTVSLLVGYFNRNTKQALDIPVGPDNRVEPYGPDAGQPTHFVPRRQWGVFTIKLPADHGPNDVVTWTIVANDHVTEIPMKLDPLWEVYPHEEATMGNTPPSIRFEQGGRAYQGPPVRGVGPSLTASASEPMTLKVWAEDDNVVDSNRRPLEGAPVRLTWSKYRGPGDVTFSETQPEVSEQTSEAVTTATFGEPGEYILRLQGNDVSRDGGGGSQCCWTNVHVTVQVSP